MARPGLKTHPKFRRLVHVLGVPVPHALGYLECVWDVCYERGDPLLGDALDVELAAQWPGEQGKLFKALLDCRFIDPVEHDRYQVHDLFDHAPDYVRKRMEREHTRKRAYSHRGRPLTADWRQDAATNTTKAELGGHCPPSGGDSRTVAVNGSPPPPPPINTPLPPTGGKRTRKRKTADPEQEAAAERVVEHYQASVSPGHGKEGAANNVLKLLADGLSEERLCACADGYAALCRNQGTEAQYRMKVRNFYGKAAGYTAYLDCQPAPAPTPDDYLARQKAEREERERRRASAAQVPNIRDIVAGNGKGEPHGQ
jgi:hypothetical protein